MKREPQLQNIHSLDGPATEAAAGPAVLTATPLPLAPAALVQAVGAFFIGLQICYRAENGFQGKANTPCTFSLIKPD